MIHNNNDKQILRNLCSIEYVKKKICSFTGRNENYIHKNYKFHGSYMVYNSMEQNIDALTTCIWYKVDKKIKPVLKWVSLF